MFLCTCVIISPSDYAVGDLKWTSNNLLSLIGIFNTVGEVLVGYLGDKEWIDLNCFYAGEISSFQLINLSISEKKSNSLKGPFINNVRANIAFLDPLTPSSIC